MSIRDRLIEDFKHRREANPADDAKQLEWFDKQTHEWRPGRSGWEGGPGEVTWYVHDASGNYLIRGAWLPGIIEMLMEREAAKTKEPR